MEVSMLKTDVCLSKNKNIPWRMIDKEAILVDIKEGESIYFNEVAAEIWNSLDGKKTIKEIAENISDTFDIDPETAKNDTLEFLKTILDKGMASG